MESGGRFQAGWERLRGVPGGRRLFSYALSLLEPYTGTLRPRLQELGPGYAEVCMPERRGVKTHLGRIHSAALVNLAEMTGNLAFMYGLPPGTQLEFVGITMDFHKPARGPITARCTVSSPDAGEPGHYEVPVVLTDAGGDVVAEALLRNRIDESG